jgi:hypothetical protein
MSIELDKEKLWKHLQNELKIRFDKRFEDKRFLELADRHLSVESHRGAQQVYNAAYFDGAVDMLEAILTYDDDIRGVEAIIAMLDKARPGTD